MRSSFLILGNLILLTVTVLSAPIQDQDARAVAPQDLGMVLGFYGVVSAVTVGVMALGTVIRGMVQNWTNRKLVDHVFEELKKYEMEKGAVGRSGGRGTFVQMNETSWKDGNAGKD